MVNEKPQINYLVQNAIDDIIFVVRNLIVGIKKESILNEEETKNRKMEILAY